MKVLLDENLPHNLVRPLARHDVKTVDSAGWKGIKNGELMKLIETNGFDVFVTGDKNLSKQTNMLGRRIALIILSTVNWPLIKPFVPVIVRAVDTAKAGTVTPVQCGIFMPRPGK